MKWFWLRADKDQKLHVRDLKPGIKVQLGDGKVAEVERLEVTKDFIGGVGRKSAMATLIHFRDHAPVLAHPNDTVDYF